MTDSKLATAEFFSGFPSDMLEQLEKAATVRKFRKNTHIIVGGEESHAAYVLLDGTAQAFTDDADGNEFVVGTFGPGDCFGELGLLDEKPRTANVMTTSNCECLVIPKHDVLRMMESDAAVAMTVVRNLVGRIRNMTDDVSCLALMDVYGRLVRLIMSATDGNLNDDGKPITNRVTHQELAKRVGSSREMVSKILKDLRVGGYISISEHRIVVEKTLPEKW